MECLHWARIAARRPTARGARRREVAPMPLFTLSSAKGRHLAITTHARGNAHARITLLGGQNLANSQRRPRFQPLLTCVVVRCRRGRRRYFPTMPSVDCGGNPKFLREPASSARLRGMRSEPRVRIELLSAVSRRVGQTSRRGGAGPGGRV